ncbi:hypothetical protein QBC46DRAFT_444564 [Diplogelasinospora grovesii]|uniref:Uncharacterized protein n=1 Tax=Diplogelasinospora grovesii TaxID=303347 RepID=A0AAN6SAF8_9PEZI|nr:hypothetical protein QBC46DRAFT_444564 [Diplogelasinospora grovesii]
MRDGDGGERLTKGIRTSCFLVADSAAIESEAAKTLYVAKYVDDLFTSVHIRPEDPVAGTGRAAGVDQREGWRAIYVQTRGPESWIRNWASDSGSLVYAHVPRATSL